MTRPDDRGPDALGGHRGDGQTMKIRFRTLKPLCLTIALLASQILWAAPARFGLSPDNSQAFLLETIGSAQRSLVINIYEFEQPQIRDAVLAAIRKGVAVRVLVEGEPVGGLSRMSHAVIRSLLGAMQGAQPRSGASTVYLMTRKASTQPRRFAFDHAKYLVVDETTVLVSSENFSFGAHPQAGLVGNRGWHVAIQDAGLAAQMLALFNSDADPSQGDVLDLRRSALPPPSDRVDNSKPEAPRTAPALPVGSGQIDAVHLVTSPDSRQGLLEFIRSAKKSVALEFMSLPATWTGEVRGQAASENPILTELLAAARRGVKVRVLLNDENAFAQVPAQAREQLNLMAGPETPAVRRNRNLETVCAIRDLAAQDHLPIEGRIISISKAQIHYVHNKGMIVDGSKAWVSSINGTRNSVMNNREVALAVEGEAAGRYFQSAFDFDWTKSSGALTRACKQAAAAAQTNHP